MRVNKSLFLTLSKDFLEAVVIPFSLQLLFLALEEESDFCENKFMTRAKTRKLLK